MPGGSEIKTLRYVFIKVLRMVGIEHNAVGETYSLYSLRHTYATMALRRRVDVYMLSRNMGASVPVIESFYGRRVTAEMGELQLGD
jgi:integrase